MAVALAEGAFGLQKLGVDEPFHHDFGVGGDFEIHCQRLAGADGIARKPARHRHLVVVDAQLLRAGEHDHRRGPDDDGAGHGLAQLLVFQPVLIAARARQAAGHAHAQPVEGLEARAVGAHVAHARLRVLGHAEGGGEIGGGVKAGRRDRHGQGGEPAAGLRQILAHHHHFLTGGIFDVDGRDGLVHAPRPDIANLLDGDAHPGGVDLGIGCQRPDHYRHVELAPVHALYIGEHEGAALGFVQPALELPAHQRMQLGVLADGPVDLHQQAALFQTAELFVEIGGGVLDAVGHRLSCCCKRELWLCVRKLSPD